MIKLNYYFEDCGGDFEFEVDERDLKQALYDILRNNTIDDFIDLLIDMDGCEIKDYFEEELMAYFKYEAYEQAKDSYEYHKDPLGYNGMSEEDFK